MSIRSLKMLALAGILFTGTGATWPPICTLGCSAREAHANFTGIQPPSGAIPESTVTITATATEEHTAAAAYALTFDLQKWNPQSGYWQWVNVSQSRQNGAWTQNGTCTEIRDVTITFTDVPLTAGENKFRVEAMVDGWDGMEDEWSYTSEVTYTH